jgi:hypothetical protein
MAILQMKHSWCVHRLHTVANLVSPFFCAAILHRGLNIGRLPLSNLASINNAISLTPGFSPVMAGNAGQNRFNGLLRADKPLKRLARWNACASRLKPGVIEPEPCRRTGVAPVSNLKKLPLKRSW